MNDIVVPQRADLQVDQAGDEPQTAPLTASAHPRRWLTGRSWLAGIALAVVFVVGTIGPPLFGRGVFLGSDLLYSSPPWQATSPDDLNYGDNGPVSDTIDGAYPVKTSFGRAARDGEWQSWTPLVAGGTPLAPTMSGVISPFALTYVAFPSWFAPAMEKLLQLVAAIGFTYLFCRRLGTDRGPALFGGLAFAGSGFMVMWSNWDQPNVAAWIPALFWATELFLQTRTVRSLAMLAVAVAAMLLGLFPTVVFYSLYILGPYVAVRLLAERDWSWMRRFTGGLGISGGLAGGIGLAAVGFAPFMARLGDQELSYRAQSSTSHLHLGNLLTTVAPSALGLSTEGPNQGYISGNQVEGVSFLGMSTVLLALACLAMGAPQRMPRGVRAVFGVATAVVLVVTYKGGPLLGLLQNLPAFDNSFVGRTRAVLGFTAGVLAALGIQSLVEGRWPERTWRWLWAGAVFVAAGVAAVAVLDAARDAMPPAPYITNLRGALVLPALIACGVLVAVGLLRFGRGGVQPWAVAGLLGLLAVESLSFAVPLLPNEDSADLYPTTPGIEFLQDHVGDARYEGDGRVMYGDATMLYGLRRMAGHVFYQPTWKQMLWAADRLSFRMSPTYPQFRADVEVATSPVFDRFGTALWAASPGVPFGEREPGGLADASCADPANLGAAPQTFDIPAGSAVRALAVRLCYVTPLPVDATVVGRASAGEAGTKARAGITRLGTTLGPSEIVVTLPEADAEFGEPQEVALQLEDADGAELALATTPAGDIAHEVVRATDDGLRLVYADDLVVYEREHALPRIRWAGRSEVVSPRVERLDVLAEGELAADTVMLDRSVEQEGEGLPASLDVVRDDPERIELRVDAEGQGFVVVADALQSDWVAEVDGRSAELLNGDHAGAAVAVPGGEHEVVLRNQPRGQRPGAVVSVVTLVLLIGLVVVEWRSPRLRWRRR